MLSSPGRTSSICRNAALSGWSSGGFFSQSRTVIARPPKVTVLPTGASISETRAVILSSPCNTAIGSEIISEAATAAMVSVNTAGASRSERAAGQRRGNYAASASCETLHPRLAGGDGGLALDQQPGPLDDRHVDHLAVDGDRAHTLRPAPCRRRRAPGARDRPPRRSGGTPRSRSPPGSDGSPRRR